MSSPTYIGLRTKRLKSGDDEPLGRRNGHRRSARFDELDERVDGRDQAEDDEHRAQHKRKGGLDPGISQWVISHGPSPTNVPGATTKNAAEPSAAEVVFT